MTICAKCRHYLSLAPLWYDQCWQASPLEQGSDPVTGQDGSRIGGYVAPAMFVRQPYAKCRTINDGNGPLYEEKG